MGGGNNRELDWFTFSLHKAPSHKILRRQRANVLCAAHARPEWLSGGIACARDAADALLRRRKAGMHATLALGEHPKVPRRLSVPAPPSSSSRTFTPCGSGGCQVAAKWPACPPRIHRIRARRPTSRNKLASSETRETAAIPGGGAAPNMRSREKCEGNHFPRPPSEWGKEKSGAREK